MSKKKTKTIKSIKLHSGRRKKHGGYSFLSRGELPENRAYIEKYLTLTRENLVIDIGEGSEDNLTASQTILIDRVICKLGVLRCLEEHVRENSVIVGNELAPSLKASYLAYSNSIRLDLQVLGIDKKKTEEGGDLAQYLIKKYPSKKKKGKKGKK